jgi:hypothetical protein
MGTVNTSPKQNVVIKKTDLFIRVYGLEIQSVMLGIFDSSLSTVALSPSLWFNSPPSPPPPCVNKYPILYTRLRFYSLWGSGPQTDTYLPQSPFTGQFYSKTTFCICLLSMDQISIKTPNPKRRLLLRLTSKGT